MKQQYKFIAKISINDNNTTNKSKTKLKDGWLIYISNKKIIKLGTGSLRCIYLKYKNKVKEVNSFRSN